MANEMLMCCVLQKRGIAILEINISSIQQLENSSWTALQAEFKNCS